MSEIIVHIARDVDWEAALLNGVYQPMSLKTAGFIHCSTRRQLLSVANTFYRGRRGLVLLYIDPDRVRAEVRYEAPAPPDHDAAGRIAEDEMFPHIYGSLNTDAVVRVVDFQPGADGHFTPPPPRREA